MRLPHLPENSTTDKQQKYLFLLIISTITIIISMVSPL